jgi:hypothetical protein
MHHILSCASPGPTESKRVTLLNLQADLTSIKTPKEVIEAITYRINQWITNQGSTQHPIHALTVGSMRGPDIL